MPGVEKGGLSGEAAREVWSGPVQVARQREEHERIQKLFGPMPKGLKAYPFVPHVPWTSLGQAPTEEQLESNDYAGAA